MSCLKDTQLVACVLFKGHSGQVVACVLLGATDPHKLLRVSSPFAHDAGGGDVEEGGVAFRRHGFGQHGLPCA